MRWMTGLKVIGCAGLIGMTVGCAGLSRITSEPTQASVSLNGRYIGTTPFSHDVKDKWGSYSVYAFTAEKEGYGADTKIIREENLFDDARAVIPPHIHFILQPLQKSGQ